MSHELVIADSGFYARTGRLPTSVLLNGMRSNAQYRQIIGEIFDVTRTACRVEFLSKARFHIHLVPDQAGSEFRTLVADCDD